MLIILGISLIPASFAEPNWNNLKVEIDKIERISGYNSDIIRVEAEFTNNDDEQISLYYDYVRLDDNKNREFSHSTYYTLQDKGHDVSERDCPWDWYMDLNPGISENAKFCFEVPRDKLTFVLHFYESYLDWCKDPSWGSCQEKTIRLSVKDPDPNFPSAPSSGPSSGSNTVTQKIKSRGDIAIAQGSSVPGCEDDRSCFVPYRLDVGKGSVVTWHNVDSAAHTVTSGTPSSGPDGAFDSSLIMSDTLYSLEFTSDGVFNYHCMIHPWMTGQVNVQRSGNIIGQQPVVEIPKDVTPPKDTTPPKMLKPVDVVIDAENQNGAKVTFDVLAIDDTDQIVRPSCNPSSGSLFSIGSTTVTCNARDSSGNRASPISFKVTVNPAETIIPNWIKNVASFWCVGSIDDASFIEGIQYLIENDIIIVSAKQSGQGNSQGIPDWIKNNACWWSEGNISDGDFASGIQYLVTNGIITIDRSNQDKVSNSSSDSAEATTIQQNDGDYPTISQKLDGETARVKLKQLADFHESLSSNHKKELAFREVDKSNFVIGVVFDGKWTLTFTEYNFEFREFEGTGMAALPFDCSHNANYIYSIVGMKGDEEGKISLLLFKNGVLIGLEQSEKPFGMAVMGGVCDEPYDIK